MDDGTDGGMDDRTDRWMEKASRPRRPLLYVITTECKLLPYNLQGAQESVTTRNLSPCEYGQKIFKCFGV
jgi:hypothetical protein